MRFDMFKQPIAIEVNSSNEVHLYKDLLKFTVANDLGVIDAAIEMVWDESSAKEHMEKFKSGETPTVALVERKIQQFKPIIPCPIWVVGLGKD